MKHIKKFENSDWEPKVIQMPKNEIIKLIKEYVLDLYFDDDSDNSDLDDCPFVTELAIIHQEDYADEIYESDYDPIKKMNISKPDFIKLYAELVSSAKNKIKEYIEEDASLIKYVDEYMSVIQKYNL